MCDSCSVCRQRLSTASPSRVERAPVSHRQSLKYAVSLSRRGSTLLLPPLSMGRCSAGKGSVRGRHGAQQWTEEVYRQSVVCSEDHVGWRHLYRSPIHANALGQSQAKPENVKVGCRPARSHLVLLPVVPTAIELHFPYECKHVNEILRFDGSNLACEKHNESRADGKLTQVK